MFETSKIEYLTALKNSGCKEGLLYENNSVDRNDQSWKKKRKHNIIWYNPPHSANVKANIDKYLKKHFE